MSKENSVLFPPVNGESRVIKEMLQVYQSRKAQAEEILQQCQEEIHQCDEAIRLNQRLLGMGDIPIEVTEAVETLPKEKGDKPGGRYGGRYIPSLYGKDTGIHARDVVQGYIENMTSYTKTFTSAHIRDRLRASKQYPKIDTTQVGSILRKLCKKGLIQKSKKSRKTKVHWVKVDRVKKKKKKKPVTNKQRETREITFRLDDDDGLPPRYNGEVGSVLLEVIHDLPNKYQGFTRQEVLDEMEIEQKSFDNAMNHLRVKGLIKDNGKSEDNRSLYVANW